MLPINDQNSARQAFQSAAQVGSNSFVFLKALVQLLISPLQFPPQPRNLSLQVGIKALERAGRVRKGAECICQGLLGRT
ncbi:MAG: hypothetical protein ABSF46_06520 [Terriglobia bacterium]